MIGKIYKSYVPYKDKGTLKYKSRPVMILAEPIGSDTEYTVLPVSTLPNKRYYSHDYDTEINPIEYDLLKLNKISYVRSHKSTMLYRSVIDFTDCLGDIKGDYPELFYEIINKYEKNCDLIVSNATKC